MIDFQGARQMGYDRLWFAIYNKHQESQSTGLQLFVDFYGPTLKFGVFRHSDQHYLRGPVERTPDTFNYSELIDFFEENKSLVLDDKPKDKKLSTIALEGKKLYKFSMGIFNNPQYENAKVTFQDNNWLVIHEETGKSQADVFKNELSEGDYVYITYGGTELFAIGKVKPGSWGQVAEDISQEEGWIYREVEYIKLAVNTDPSKLKSNRELIYPSGNSTLTEIPLSKIQEANDRLFIPYFKLQFISPEAQTTKGDLKKRKFAKNIILYGPPGTGKTYHTIDRAVEIINGENKGNREDNVLEFDRLRKAGQVEFVTFHQNYTYEDFMVGIRPDLDEANTLKFKKVEGIFYSLCKKARQNLLLSQKDAETLRPFQEVFKEFISPLEEEEREIEVRMVSGNASFWITDINPNNLGFRKQSGGRDHTLSIGTIQELYEESRDFSSGLRYYYMPVINQLWELGKQASSQVSLQNYVLIIDEINRANISRVFGELITLLEEDKRLGEKNALRITLPNGEKDFGIPPNLYLIGTMNTADKSIALVDIALRRRFEFIGYYPDYSKLDESHGELLKHINSEIYKRKKSADYLIGHAYFMNDEGTKNILKKKVIPLLMEYFSGKTDLIEEIFSKSGWIVTFEENNYDWNISQTD